ncbi:hypothetical protein E4U21_002284 [Claviceps maximensis]|nr:hypothetical protein E4U21_002284 [Claviceps maximensis]
MLPSPFAPSQKEITRPISVPRTKSSASSRFWKWKTRSSRKTASEVEGRDPDHISPSLSIPSPLSNFADRNTPQVASPYLSESAHVLSLQHPAEEIEPLDSDKTGAVTPKSKDATVKTGKDPTSMVTKLDSQQSISQPNAHSINPKVIESQESNLSKVGDYFLIPPGINSRPLLGHDKGRMEKKDGVLENLDEAKVGRGPAKTIPWGSFWLDGSRRRESRLKLQIQLSKYTRKYLKRPRFQSRSRCRSLCSMTKSRRSSGRSLCSMTKSRRSSDVTNKVSLLNTPPSANKPGGGASQYASDRRGHSRWQAKELLQFIDASCKQAGQSFLNYAIFTPCASETNPSRIPAEQYFFPAA